MKITNRWTGNTIYDAVDAKTVHGAVMLALKHDADLSGANLIGTNLSDADLIGTNLSGANLIGTNLSAANLSAANLSRADLIGTNLSDANLSDANLSDADLIGTNLSGANLSGADLSGADLTRADLSRANLSGADLTRADLTRADLSGADLTRADLSRAKEDFLAILRTAPSEVTGLRQALIDGRINGQTYEGECACLVGTIAKIRHISYDEMPGLRPNSRRPAERLFLAILKGDTPENHPIAAIVLTWIDEWLAAQPA